MLAFWYTFGSLSLRFWYTGSRITPEGVWEKSKTYMGNLDCKIFRPTTGPYTDGIFFAGNS